MGTDPANGVVLGMVVAFISFVVWVRICSMKEEKKNQQDKPR